MAMASRETGREKMRLMGERKKEREREEKGEKK